MLESIVNIVNPCRSWLESFGYNNQLNLMDLEQSLGCLLFFFYTSFDSGEPQVSAWLILSPSFTLAWSENGRINQNNNKKKNSQNVAFFLPWTQAVCPFLLDFIDFLVHFCLHLTFSYQVILSYVYKNRCNPITYYWSYSCVQKRSESKCNDYQTY